MKINCSHCGQSYRIGDDLARRAGAGIHCQKCGRTFRLPPAEGTPSPDAGGSRSSDADSDVAAESASGPTNEVLEHAAPSVPAAEIEDKPPKETGSEAAVETGPSPSAKREPSAEVGNRATTLEEQAAERPTPPRDVLANLPPRASLADIDLPVPPPPPRAASRFRPAPWIWVVAGGAALLLVGLLMLPFLGNSEEENGSPDVSQGTQNGPQSPTDVPRETAIQNTGNGRNGLSPGANNWLPEIGPNSPGGGGPTSTVRRPGIELPGIDLPEDLDLASIPLAWANADWAVLVRPGQRPSVNGVPMTLPAGKWTDRPWPLVLPPGKHVVQCGAALPIEEKSTAGDFSKYYGQERAKYVTGGKLSAPRLAEASLPSLGVFQEPLLPHLWGNFFWQAKQCEAAVRFWNWSVRIAPSYAPAHLNLAYAHSEQGNRDGCLHELRLAAGLNFQDAFGLGDHIVALSEQINAKQLLAQAPGFDPADYRVASAGPSRDQQRVVHALDMLGVYATDDGSQARAWNNVGVYLSHELQEHELAITYYRRALASLAEEYRIPEQRDLIRHILSNLVSTMEQAGMPEHIVYAQVASRL